MPACKKLLVVAIVGIAGYRKLPPTFRWIHQKEDL